MKRVLFIVCFCMNFNLYAADIDFKNRGDSRINYSKYGEFKGVGTNEFHYKVKDKKGLKKQVGDFIYPNTGVPRFLKKRYKKIVASGVIRKNDVWSHLKSGDNLLDILAWVSTPIIEGNLPDQTEGIKQFFIGDILAHAGEYEAAIKAYYGVVLFFPRTYCWNADGSFVWYVGPAALDRINLLLREHPELNLKLKDAYIEVENANDTDINNDIIKVNPGTFIALNGGENRSDVSYFDVLETKGSGRVKIVKYTNNHWQLMVHDKPFVVKGVTYAPTKVGTKGSEMGRETKWMHIDSNKNGKSDAAYDAWVDANKNNKRDKGEKRVGDFQLMKEMGVNTIRLYHSLSESEYLPEEIDKNILRDLYRRYGIMTIMGDFVGAYGIGSGGGRTDYRNARQKKMMKASVRNMVLDHKDEPYVLMWVLGNENDMPDTSAGVNYTNTNARKYPDAYASFISELIQMIHDIDPEHPVMVGNMTTDLIPYYNKYTPKMDIYGINLYMGKEGFGGNWKKIARNIGVPVIVSEYGCDAYYDQEGVDEIGQAEYHRGNWKDIKYNLASNNGIGNALGGIVFEWMDEWWKSGASPLIQDEVPQSALPFPDGWSHEEWFGLVSQGNGKKSPFLRQLRKVYFIYKDELWADNN
ncbi:MAG: hypothetical protein GY817_08225 [bacterium]|nr:hypothetical protein [bacterium]